MQKTLTTPCGLWLVMVLTGLGLLWAPASAHAHDVLVDSNPEVGATVASTPEEVRLQFSGTPLTGQGLTNLIRVTDGQGNQWQDGEATVAGYELTVSLCEGLPQGDYDVAYRVIYSDGHTGEERFSFTNADPNAPAHGTPDNCGDVAAQAGPVPPEDSDSSTALDTRDPQTHADDTAAAAIPGWVWLVGGVGLLVIAAIVVLLLRGHRTGQASTEPSED